MYLQTHVVVGASVGGQVHVRGVISHHIAVGTRLTPSTADASSHVAVVETVV